MSLLLPALTAVLLTSASLFVARPVGPVPRTGSVVIVAQSDSAAVASLIRAYHDALVAGDSTKALGLLAPDAVILESGGVETLAAYRAHHLVSDIGFARTVKQTRSAIHVRIRGDVAWATSTSEAVGESRGRPVNSVGAELAVVTRTSAGWRISAFHWSSRARRS